LRPQLLAPTLSATRSLRTTLDAARRRWPGDAAPFYDALAEYYDLIFEDWDASMARQGAALEQLIQAVVEFSPGEQGDDITVVVGKVS